MAISVTVKYTLKGDRGHITLVIQKADNGYIGTIMEPIKKGSNKIALKKSITIPETMAISVFISLAVQGETKTTVVDSRTFTVNK
ncbi:MAG: hypothetical protein KKD35_02810 [Elusimicrobia bacterium]|nr:hypothetical protein [Elusimicrobiota bacterium]